MKIIHRYLALLFSLLLIQTLQAQWGWERTANITDFPNSIYFADSLKGWYAGMQWNGGPGVIRISTDGGFTWTQQTTTTKPLNKIIFIDNVGFCSGDGGVILKTADEGKNWLQKPSGTTKDLKSIFFFNDNLGWACGEQTITRITDGGESWAAQQVNNIQEFRDISFGTELLGWTVGLNGKHAKTTDGGLSWISDSPSPLNNFTYWNIKFFTSDIAIAAGENIARTSDGGKTWIIHADKNVYGIAFADQQVGWAAGIYIIHTIDGGLKWVEQDAGASIIFCLNRKFAWAALAGGQNAILRTTDGGLYPPSLVFPDQSGTERPLILTLSWNSSDDATMHRVQLATDPAFTNIVLDNANVSGTTLPIGPLNLNTEYYWRVLKKSLDVESPWSLPSDFHTTKGSPLLSSPENNSKDISLTVTFYWKDVTMIADSYQLQLSTDSSFNDLIVNDSTINNNYLQINQLSDSTIYFWRVRTKVNHIFGAWSAKWSFRTLQKTPGLLFPLNNAFNVPVKVILQWSKTAETNNYILQVSNDSLFTSYIVNEGNITNQSYEAVLNYETKYFWRVGAVDFNGQIYWSGKSCFTTGTQDAALFPLAIGNKWFFQYYSTYSYNMNKYGIEYEIVDITSNGFYKVMNKSFYRDSINYSYMYWLEDNGKFYQTASNNLSQYDMPLYNPDFKHDTSFVYISRYTDSWYYNLTLINVFGQPADAQIVGRYNHGMVSAFNEHYTTAVGYGIIKYTSSVFGAGAGKDSSELIGIVNGGKLIGDTTIVNPFRKSSLILPSNNSINIPLQTTFYWSKAYEAISYRLQISTDSAFTNIILNIPGITDISKFVDNLQFNTKYFWRIQTTSMDGNSYWSDIFNFTTINSAMISKPLFPVNNAVDVQRSLTFKWNKVASANSYRLQISNDSSLTNLFKDYPNLTDTTLYIDTLNWFTQYYWRIETNSSNGYNYWSQIWKFTTIGHPTEFKLYQNYPNPFNTTTRISYQIPQSGFVSLKIYDILGKEVVTLINEFKPTGIYNCQFSADNFQLPSGVYFYRFQSGSFVETKKLILMK